MLGWKGVGEHGFDVLFGGLIAGGIFTAVGIALFVRKIYLECKAWKARKAREA